MPFGLDLNDQATNNNKRFTFRKEERLCSQKIIAGLFEPGFFVTSYPFRANVLVTELPNAQIPAQVMFVVGKKRFKKAVDRNRVKRILRELYRMEKQKVYDQLSAKGKQIAIALIYTGAELPDFHTLRPKFQTLITKLCHAISAQ